MASDRVDEEKALPRGSATAPDNCPYCKRDGQGGLDLFREHARAKHEEKTKTQTIIVALSVGLAVAFLVILAAVSAAAYSAGVCKKRNADVIEYFGTAGGTGSSPPSSIGSYVGTPSVVGSFNPNPIVSSSDLQ